MNWLGAWAAAAGIALWVPAFAPIKFLPIQFMDIVIAAGMPLLIQNRDGATWFIVGMQALSMTLSFAVVGGQLPVLMWQLIFACPFVALMALVFGQPIARFRFASAFVLAGGMSVALFWAQILWGARAYDFRNNMSFRLPPQFERGFALFPEVSIYATHAAILVGLCAVLILDRRVRGIWVTLASTIGTCALVSLFWTQSTSVFVMLPLVIAFSALASARSHQAVRIGTVAVTVIFLVAYFMGPYADRLASTSALRSGDLRLSSILGAITPVLHGQFLGVGVGNNEQVARYIFSAAHDWGIMPVRIPQGISSHIFTRIFEEGVPAIVAMALAVFGGLRRSNLDVSPDFRMIWLLILGSAISAFFITGYRGIYTNWIWLAAVGAGSWRRS